MGETERAGRLTLQPQIKSQAAQKGASTERRTGILPPLQGKSGPNRSQELLPTSTDLGQVCRPSHPLWFSSDLHLGNPAFQKFKPPRLRSYYTAPSPLPVVLPFFSSPEVDSAPRSLYCAHQQRKRVLRGERWCQRRVQGSGKNFMLEENFQSTPTFAVRRFPEQQVSRPTLAQQLIFYVYCVLMGNFFICALIIHSNLLYSVMKVLYNSVLFKLLHIRYAIIVVRSTSRVNSG